MRFLQARDLTFVSFEDLRTMPKYAILSHTWGEDEVTYKEMRKHPERVLHKEGYRKIQAFACEAFANGFDYIWVDTCCIDKSSSAELSEAINSMFRLYRSAAICYAYLSDVVIMTDDSSWTSQFETSRWFIRGWTLQELIAPRELVFYAQDWTCIGSKLGLTGAIVTITGIPKKTITTGEFSDVCVAQRMSWAARRSTSREEDVAYSLMGLFNVNMPMLYGEGNKAFLRLQEEILKNSDDMSIFAWTNPYASFETIRGLLAKSPGEFSGCCDFRWTRKSTNGEPYQVTNKGIRISLPLMPGMAENQILNARLSGVVTASNKPADIRLQQVGQDQYARVDVQRLQEWTGPSSATRLTSLFVRQEIVLEDILCRRTSGVALILPNDASLELADVQPSRRWSEKEQFFHFSASSVDGYNTVTFTVTGAAICNTIIIIVDAEQPQGKAALRIEDQRVGDQRQAWITAAVQAGALYKVYCYQRQGSSLEISLKHGLRSDRGLWSLQVGLYNPPTLFRFISSWEVAVKMQAELDAWAAYIVN